MKKLFFLFLFLLKTYYLQINEYLYNIYYAYYYDNDQICLGKNIKIILVIFIFYF